MADCNGSQVAKTAAWRMVITGAAVANFFTTFLSTASLVAQHFFNCEDGYFWDTTKNHPGVGFLMWWLGASAVGGIIFLNVWGLFALRNEIYKSIYDEDPKVRSQNRRNLVYRALLAPTSGIAMAMLAANYNTPYLMNGNSDHPIKYFAGWINAFYVGNGVGGAVLGTLKDTWRTYAPAPLIGKENRTFEDILYYMRCQIKHSEYGDSIKQFNAQFKAAQGDGSLVDALKTSPQKFAQLSIHNHAYPTALDSWWFKAPLRAASFAASTIGAWGLRAMAASGLNAGWLATLGLNTILPWGALITNVILWAPSLINFIENSINCRRQFVDTWNNSTKLDIALIALAVYLASSFGSMMMLIPLLMRVIGSKDWFDQDFSVYTQAGTGFGINAIIGSDSMNAVFKFFLGWRTIPLDDIATGNIDALGDAFRSLSVEEQQAVLQGWKQGAEQQEEATTKAVVEANVKVNVDRDPLLNSTASSSDQTSSDQASRCCPGTTLNQKILSAIGRYGALAKSDSTSCWPCCSSDGSNDYHLAPQTV